MTAPRIGEVFDGRYRIDAELGAGGMGTVYAATQLSIGRPVALKVLRAGLEASERHVRRFQREAAAAGKLTHPHTVRTFDFGMTSDGMPYLVTELLRGETLSERLRRGPLPASKAATVAGDVLTSLAEAHRRGLVHRDVKPANVFLAVVGDERDFVKVLDFGMVKLTEGTDRLGRVTRTGVVGGTPAYTSPENALNEEIDGRSDLYSVGVMLYEMVSGRLPFERSSSFEVLLAHVRDPVPPLDGVAPALTRLISRCLEKSPDLRPQTAEALRDALAAVATPSDASPAILPARPTATAPDTISAEVPSSALETILLEAPTAFPSDRTTEHVVVRARWPRWLRIFAALAGVALLAYLFWPA